MSDDPQIPNEPNIALTDDEVLALASRADLGWPSVTPTVDTTDRGLVEAAVRRGARSLIVRNLLGIGGEDQLDPRVALLADPVLRGERLFGTYPASGDLTYLPIGVSTACYRADDMWVGEIVTAVGVHYLSQTDDSTWQEVVIGLLSELYDRSSLQEVHQAAGSDVSICAVGPPSETSVRIAAVRPGSVVAMELAKQRRTIVGSLASVSEAIRYVLA